MTNPPDQCLVTWPTEATQGDRLQPRPEHKCALTPAHIHLPLCEQLPPATIVVPHRCRCGAVLPVRDVVPA